MFRTSPFPTVLTFFWNEKKDANATEIDDLHKVLLDNEMKHHFKQFAATELSIENIMFNGLSIFFSLCITKNCEFY